MWYKTTKNMSEIPPPSYKRNQATIDEKQLTSTYGDSAVSFLYNEANYNNDNSTVNDLDLAQGLIDLLIENNFTLESLINTSVLELAKTLGIDQDVAAIICTAANRKRKKINGSTMHLK
ncbi:MAG: hypothetical protein ACJ702_01985 [Nitrososphaeraceae archaeon]|jgi:hypothetical protein